MDPELMPKGKRSQAGLRMIAFILSDKLPFTQLHPLK
jgi:hypothetical protein